MKKIVIPVIIIVLIASGLLFWFIEEKQDQGELTLYGNVDIRTVNLSYRVAGRLESLNVDEGDAVTAGQKIGTLDAKPYQIALSQSEANIAAAQAQIEQLTAAYEYSQNFLKRQEKLWQDKSISDNELDNAKTNNQQNSANLDAAKAKLQQALALHQQALLNLSDTTLTSPSDGIILTRAVEPGTLLNAGSTVFTLSLTHPVWIRAYVDEVNLAKAVPGQEVAIYIDGKPSQPYQGKIGFISPSAEFTPKSVETPTLRTDLVYRLRIIVTNPDDSLRQGMPVTIKLTNQ